jgi:hypothetical protein
MGSCGRGAAIDESKGEKEESVDVVDVATWVVLNPLRVGKLVTGIARGVASLFRGARAASAVISDGKIGYLLGRASGNIHNLERASQNAS